MILTCIVIGKDVNDIPYYHSQVFQRPKKVWQTPLKRDKTVFTKNELYNLLT